MYQRIAVFLERIHAKKEIREVNRYTLQTLQYTNTQTQYYYYYKTSQAQI